MLIMAVVGAFALLPACLAFPRTSRRGQKYLAELAIVYSRLKSQLKATGHALADDSLAGDHEREPEPALVNGWHIRVSRSRGYILDRRDTNAALQTNL